MLVYGLLYHGNQYNSTYSMTSDLHLTRSYQDLEEQYRGALLSCIRDLDSQWTVGWREAGEVKWCQVSRKGTTLPKQGWKIHVSASASEAASLCRDVLPWIMCRGVTCKIVADIASIIRLNSGLAGETQTGKILTVYPSDEREAANLAVALDQLWASTEGPAVPSDLALREQGAVFLRYGAIDGNLIIDRFGKVCSALRMSDGTYVEDQRSSDGQQPDWVKPPLGGLVPAVQPISGPFQIRQESYLPLRLLHASPYGQVFSGLSLSDASEVLIKIKRRGVDSNLFGSSGKERLQAENEALHALAAIPGMAPRPLGYFKGRDFGVLITELFDGQQYSELDFERQSIYLPRLAAAVSELHRAGYVHRDIKLTNAILTGDDVRLIDFELAFPLGAQPISKAGTRGYMPPEDESCTSGAGDVYALGTCIAHVYLGFDPGGLPAGNGRLIGLLTLFGHRQVAHAIRKLMAARPEQRPCAKAVVQMLESLPFRSSNEPNQRIEAASQSRRVKPSWCLRAAHEAGQATRQFQREVSTGIAWKGRQYESQSSAESINIGSAGVILGLSSIDTACGSWHFTEDIQGGAKWLACQQPYVSAHGLFTGNAGVAVSLAIAGRRFTCSEWIDASRVRLIEAARVEQDCDLFSGSAGVLWAACLVSQILEDHKICELVDRCGNELIRLVELRDGLCVWPPAEPEAQPLTGAAHGSAGIAMALAIWGRTTGRLDAIDLAYETFERIFRNGRLMNGTMLRRTVDAPAECAPVLTWCHGVAGYLWCMLLAFGDDDRLRSEIDWSIEKCAAARSLGNPTYCHGVAGELELWRLVGKYQRLAACAASRSERAAAGLRLQHLRERALSVWAAEDPRILTPDLWVGFLGPATALALHAVHSGDSILSGDWLRSCAIQKL